LGGDEDMEAEDLFNEGKKINRDEFKIIKVIGRGSFGKVFLVKRKESNDGKVYAMKVLIKSMVAKRNLITKTHAEREILGQIKSPFIVNLYYAFQTEAKLYFVMDFLNGGELFYHLRKDKKFTEERACFYAAQLVSSLGTLHAAGIIYRDLKPENVLLAADGYLKITDFGLSKTGLDNMRKGGQKTYSFCGTPEYLAPEIIEGVGHDKSVDWWSLGAILYEMLCGMPPHYQKNRKQMLKDIVEKPVPMHRNFSSNSVALLRVLLERTPHRRIGYGAEDAEQLRKHPFFANIDWKKLEAKELKVPYKPYVSSAEDCRNIDKMFTDERATETPVDENGLSGTLKKKTKFEGFTYDNETQLKGLGK
jgi:serine/threonine protein kinase